MANLPTSASTQLGRGQSFLRDLGGNVLNATVTHESGIALGGGRVQASYLLPLLRLP